MSVKLALVPEEPAVSDGRRGHEGGRREEPFADDSMRLIATLWEWAALRELAAGSR